MSSLAPLITVGMIWVVAAMTPGPNFLLTARVAAVRSRVAGLMVVLGIAIATAIWGCAGLLGIHALFIAAPWFYWAFKLAGGAYLLYLGLRLLLVRARRQDGVPRGSGAQPLAPLAAFRLGLATSLANPKSALSVTSIFAAALPASPSPLLGGLAVALMVAISTLWYALVVWLLTLGAVSAAFARLRHWIDRVAGALFVMFGLRLALDRA